MRVFAISDLRADFAENWKALQWLSLQDYKNDVILIAGDIADNLSVVAKTLAHMRARFGRVFYVPGNHELWTRRDDCHSPAKLERILQLCDDLGVCAKPARVGELWIVPLLSWYEEGFDEDQSADTETLEAWADYYFCKWPPWINSVAE